MASGKMYHLSLMKPEGMYSTLSKRLHTRLPFQGTLLVSQAAFVGLAVGGALSAAWHGHDGHGVPESA